MLSFRENLHKLSWSHVCTSPVLDQLTDLMFTSPIFTPIFKGLCLFMDTLVKFGGETAGVQPIIIF